MKKGFTLVEVVIALAIMALVMGAFIGTFTRAKYAATTANKSMTALREARARMENLLTLTYGQLTYGINTFSNGFYTVSPNASYSNAVKDIVMTVRWVNPGSRITSSLSLYGSISSELHQP